MAQVAVFVIGPAGVGKSTFCSTFLSHCQSIGRSAHLVNLDPAAESFSVKPTIDIRDLVSLPEVMESTELGPNGGLIFCMEQLLENADWLEADLTGFENDFLFVDCPGQIEIYSHYAIMRRIVDSFSNCGYRCLVVYLVECQFTEDHCKFFAATLNAMSAMIQLEVPHMNILTKVDQFRATRRTTDPSKLTEEQEEEDETLFYEQHLSRYLDADSTLLAETAFSDPKYERLNTAVVELIEQFGMVSFLPLNITKESSISAILYQIDMATQYGESLEPKEDRLNEPDE